MLPKWPNSLSRLQPALPCKVLQLESRQNLLVGNRVRTGLGHHQQHAIWQFALWSCCFLGGLAWASEGRSYINIYAHRTCTACLQTRNIFAKIRICMYIICVTYMYTYAIINLGKKMREIERTYLSISLRT